MRTSLAGCAVAVGALFSAALFPANPGGDSANYLVAHDNDRPTPSDRLVVHEWGTFTSFSGSDGIPVGFQPNNADLPPFVYYRNDEGSKGARLRLAGTVSMETPVIYFYAEKEMHASI